MFTHSALLEETPALKRFAYKLTQNIADAEDLLQSTLLRALEKKHLFNAGTNLFSWTSRIMYNMFVTGYRRKVKFESQYDPEPVIGLQKVDASQELHVELREVDVAMKKLTKQHREILVMVCALGIPYEEVAYKLDIPVGTVRSRLSRARSTLMSVMNDNSKASSHKVAA